MPKSDFIEMEGEIVGVLPNAVFKVKLSNDRVIEAHVSGKVRTHYIRILPGDKVIVHVSPYDLNRGRIIFRKK